MIPGQSEGPINAYITNLGKYNEGELVGKWHSFPTTPEEIQQTLKEIGIGGQYEEFFITDYDTNISGIYDTLPEYASLDELNYLAVKLDEMVNSEIKIYGAALETGEYTGSVQDLINLTENLDCYDFAEDITDDSDLGYYYVEDSGIYDLKSMGNLANYIDYEKFGRDVRFEEGGQYTDVGYIRNNGNTFHEIYNGMDVPDEYRVSSVPEREPSERPSVMEKLAAAKEAVSKAERPEQAADKPKTKGPEL